MGSRSGRAGSSRWSWCLASGKHRIVAADRSPVTRAARRAHVGARPTVPCRHRNRTGEFCMRCLRIAALSAAALFTASGIAQAQTPKESPQLANEGWRTEIYPLFWLAPEVQGQGDPGPTTPGFGEIRLFHPRRQAHSRAPRPRGFGSSGIASQCRPSCSGRACPARVTTPSFDLDCGHDLRPGHWRRPDRPGALYRRAGPGGLPST